MNSQGKRALRGIFYSGSEGTEILFIDENYGVLQMVNNSGNPTLLDNLKDGDFIEVMMDVLYETPPANMPIYDMLVLKRGTKDDLPQDKIRAYEERIESTRYELNH